MKRLLLTLFIVAGMCAGTPLIQAHEEGNGPRLAYSWFGWQGIQARIDHLNRMVGHVRWQMGRYRPDGSIRRDFEQIRREVNEVNERHQHGGYNRRELLRRIESLHVRLHQLEIRMRVRARDYYNWR